MSDVNGMSINSDVLDDLGQFALDMSHKRLENPSEYTWDDVTEAIEAEADQYGLELIGDGSNRIVFADPETNGVVKFALDTEMRSGLEQNRVEAYIWDALEEVGPLWSYVVSRFFPVLDSDPDNRWLVMEKAVWTEGDEEFGPEGATVAMFDTFEFLTPDSEFALTENIGWNPQTNQYALFDYGSFIPRPFIENVLGPEHFEPIGEDNIAEGRFD